MSDISVGSVSVDITPNLTTFFPKLKAGVEKASVSVIVEPNLTGFKAKMDAATRERRTKVKADADTAKAEEQLDHVARDRKVKIDASGGQGLSLMAQGLIAAAPLIGPLSAGVAGLGLALGAPLVTTGAALTVGGILSGAAVKQTQAQKTQIDALHKSVLAAQQSLANTTASSTTSAGISSAGAQRSAALQMATAQAQASKTIAAARQAEASATTAAGRASAARAIQTAQATLVARQAAIQAGLSNSQATATARTSASQAAAQRKVNEATAAYQKALDGLSPSQRAFITAQGDVKSAFHDLIGANGGALLAPVTTGFDALAHVLPKLGPFIVPVSSAVSSLLADVDRYANSKGFDKLVSGFGTAAGRDILTFGRDAENVLAGTFGLLKQFGPLSTDFTSWLSGITADYKKFGQGAGSNPQVQQFVSYLRTEGPQVAQTLGAVADAIGHVVVALAPIGGVELEGIKVLAQDISKIPIGVLKTVGVEAAGLFVVMKGASVLDGFDTKLTSLSQNLGKLSVNGTDGGALGKAQTAVRGFAGAAGLGLITVGVSNANTALGTLETIGGGALAGFAVGGPIGAGIGAVGAGLFELGKKALQSGTDARISIGGWRDLESTLDGVTGAITDQTKATELQRLQKSGAFKVTDSLGLSKRDVVSAIVDGGSNAQLLRNRLNTQAQVISDNANTQIADLQAKAQAGGPAGERAFGPRINAIRAETAARLANIQTILTELGAVTQASNAKKADINILANYGPALAKLPKSAQILVNTKGLFTTKTDIANLAKSLDNKQIRLVLGLTHVTATVGQIRAIEAAADKAARPRTLSFTTRALGLANSLNGAPVQGGIGSLLAPKIPGRVAGGPVLSGLAYIVGERRPELFVPDQNGRIEPNVRQAGDTHHWTFTGDIRPTDFNDFLRQLDVRRRHAAMGGAPV